MYYGTVLSSNEVRHRFVLSIVGDRYKIAIFFKRSFMKIGHLVSAFVEREISRTPVQLVNRVPKVLRQDNLS
jgi:hypothetical protein